jgi:FixJ family two-component response regulator
MMPKRPRIAIVDNDDALLKALGRLMQANGYLTELFASAEMFLARQSNMAVDCLILDIHLDGMSGIDLRTKLLRAGCAPPTIFITAERDALAQVNAMGMGDCGYLIKPFEARALIEALHRAVKLNG